MNEAYVKVQRCPKAHTKIYSKTSSLLIVEKRLLSFLAREFPHTIVDHLRRSAENFKRIEERLNCPRVLKEKRYFQNSSFLRGNYITWNFFHLI